MTWNIFRNVRHTYTPDELKQLIILSRFSRYNRSAPSGAKAIRREMESLDIHPLPSLSFIARVLRKEGLTYRRTGNY